jgi:class 3 adenylate cyclase
MSFKKLLGENKILKSKLEELEDLRKTNTKLYNSTQNLEELNQELERQRDEIRKQKCEIEIEKRRSEDLLLNILPEETSRELIIHGVTKTQFYKKVTVLFSDFKGFTKVCEHYPPQDIVSELDRHFSKFDEICEQHFVEKIKTIGDAYMCAGGIPMRNNSNPVDVILVALGILDYMEKVNAEKRARGIPSWDIRIGINTGSIIAGVIGKKKFAYDIWGDTVNTASRMETSGEIGKVNISGQTYQYVKNFFVCEYRGPIECKSKGEIDMYFVLGIKPELSQAGEGKKPNNDFHHQLARL